MEKLKELEKTIRDLGFFKGQVELKISLRNEFEGFYGILSDTWESQVSIEIISPNENVINNVKVIGRREGSISDVASRVLDTLNPNPRKPTCSTTGDIP